MPGRLKVEVGSGYAPTPGFTHVDINPNAPQVDHVCSADDLPFRDGQVDELRAVDVWEHFSYRDSQRVLTEWARVLRPGGRMFVQVPDAHRMMHGFLVDPARWVTPEFEGQPAIVSIAWRILGGHDDGQYADGGAGDDWRWNAHYALFSPESVRWFMDRCGMDVTSLEVNPFPNIQCWAVKRGAVVSQRARTPRRRVA
jgi:SAM-dependent methyltransferase